MKQWIFYLVTSKIYVLVLSAVFTLCMHGCKQVSVVLSLQAALSCAALRSALPCPALPCPALPCLACPHTAQYRINLFHQEKSDPA